MQACAVGGNVVIVNVSQLRSDAIIVSLTTFVRYVFQACLRLARPQI